MRSRSLAEPLRTQDWERSAALESRHMTAGPSGVRERRLACGLTQAELASRAGVSRQLVAAVEASRHSPAVDAALGIAKALGTSVEVLFTPPRGEAVAAVGGQLDEGTLLRVGRIDSRLVATALADHGVAGAGWANPDGVVEGGKIRLLPGAIPSGFVIAGCDPALGVAEAMLAGMGPLSLLAMSAPTKRALSALQDGRLHAAVVHGPVNELPEPPVKVARWNLAKWQVGLAVAPRLRGQSLDAVLKSNKPIIQQCSGAASQQAFERARHSAGLEGPATGPQASSPIDAARRASDRGTMAVTIEACARAFDLGFLPIEEHTVQIWVDDRWVGHPGLTALGEILNAPSFTERVARFGGYDLGHCGERIAA